MKKNILLRNFRFALILSVVLSLCQIGFGQTITPIAIDHTIGYGSGCSGVGLGDGTPATGACASFAMVTDLAVDTVGDLFINDLGNSRIRKVNKGTGILLTIAGGGTGGDGGPGVLASIGPVSGMCVDRQGNCFINDQNIGRIRKISATSGIISSVTYCDFLSGIYADTGGNIFYSRGNKLVKYNLSSGAVQTIAGTGTVGFSGDGGPATAAAFNTPNSITGDAAGNIYFADGGNHRVRKINTSGIISTIAGGGNLYPEGCNVLNARLFPMDLNLDTLGNIFLLDSQCSGVKRIDVSTGIINTIGYDTFVAYTQNWYNLRGLAVGNDGSIYTPTGYGIMSKIIGAIEPMNTLSVRDSIVSTACTLPAVHAIKLSGTLSGVPGATDSLTVVVDYGDHINWQYDFTAGSTDLWDYYSWRYLSTTRTFRLPYTYGAGGYSFGLSTILDTFAYRRPGVYYPSLTIVAANNYHISYFLAPDTVGANCTPGLVGLVGYGVTDSTISTLCSLPKIVQLTMTGYSYDTSMGCRFPTSSDSAYVYFDFGDSTSQLVVVPYDSVFSSYYTYTFTAKCNHTYLTPGTYYPAYYIVNAQGTYSSDNYSMPPSLPVINAYACGHGVFSSNVREEFHTTHCSLPYTATYDYSAIVTDSAAFMPVVKYYINLGDGFDTTIVDSFRYSSLSHDYRSSGSFRHTFTMPGTYIAYHHDTAGYFTMSGPVDYGTTPSELVLGTSCSPVSGYFYMDTNANCSMDAGERHLGYWPFAIIDNTAGDTIYRWCDDGGHYAVDAINGHSYTLITDLWGYFGTGVTEATLTASCPTTGIYTFTATSGSTVTHNFAFTCNLPSTMDMRVDAWGWGFIPGDTGFINVWSSNSWGYMCDDTFSSSVTLIKDHRLTYAGMWFGPTPTTISGDSLTFHFTSAGNLLDFNAAVKVSTDTAASIYDTLKNQVYVAPTRIPDHSISNNTYSWDVPVMTSWDPNEIQVAPKGSGSQGYIENGTPLSYLIHFQNTGNARARNITVVDTINSNLDISTLQVVNSSAPVLVFQAEGNVIKFRFNDIYLPDSASNPDGSIGFVSYNIIPKDSLAPLTRITNKAGIYFDYNPPVFTNSTLNTIEDTLGVISGNNNVCIGAHDTLGSNIPNGIWACSNSNATLSGAVLTGVTTGADTVTYTVYGHLMTTKVIQVMAAPAPVTLAGGNQVCVNATITLVPSESGGIWSAHAGKLSITGGVVTGIATGMDTAFYNLANTCGSSKTNAVITVNPLPVAGTISGDTSLCKNGTLLLSTSNAGGTWSMTNANATINAGTVTGVNAGNCVVIYTFTNGCGTDFATHNLTVLPLPDAGTITGIDSLCAQDTIQLADNISGGVWSTSNPDIVTITPTGKLTASNSGSASVAYTAINSCGNAIATLPVVVKTTAECNKTVIVNNPKNVVIYPNPSTGIFLMEVPTHKGDINISIQDVRSKNVGSMKVTNNQLLQIPVDMSNMPSGMYLINAEVDGKIYRMKVVVL